MDATRTSVERVARDSYGRLVAYLAPRCGIDAAQDALSDAFASALTTWPCDGVPAKPEAWLLTVARHRFIDRVRRGRREQTALERVALATEEAVTVFDAPVVADERIGMLFACAHPAIAPAVRAPLMLQIVLGIDAARIASAFLVNPATMGQRLVRAKKKITEAGVPLRVPESEEFPHRLDAVLNAIYACFCEGWGDPSVIDPRTLGLAQEAIWLARVVTEACPREPEATGLLALMLHAHARRASRRDAQGAFVPLDEQDASRWDHAMIEEAESLLSQAAPLRRPGRFQLEAAIQSAHAVRRFGVATDWGAIVLLYDALHAMTGSPVVALNRAVAIARAQGADAGLAALNDVCDERLRDYQPYWAARADMLANVGDSDGALESYQRAIGLTVDPAARAFLASRAERLTLGRTVR